MPAESVLSMLAIPKLVAFAARSAPTKARRSCEDNGHTPPRLLSKQEESPPPFLAKELDIADFYRTVQSLRQTIGHGVPMSAESFAAKPRTKGCARLKGLSGAYRSHRTASTDQSFHSLAV